MEQQSKALWELSSQLTGTDTNQRDESCQDDVDFHYFPFPWVVSMRNKKMGVSGQWASLVGCLASIFWTLTFQSIVKFILCERSSLRRLVDNLNFAQTKKCSLWTTVQTVPTPLQRGKGKDGSVGAPWEGLVRSSRPESGSFRGSKYLAFKC